MERDKALNLMTEVSKALETIMTWYPASGNRKDGPQIVVGWCQALDDVPVDLIEPGVALLRKRANRDFMPSALALRDCINELARGREKTQDSIGWQGPFGELPETDRKNRAAKIDFDTIRKQMEKKRETNTHDDSQND